MEKIRSLKGDPAARAFVGFMGTLASGFLLSGTEIAGVSSFSDISLTGALPLPYASAVLIGALVRSIIGQSVGRNIVRLAAMMIIVIFRLAVERRSTPRADGILTAVAVLISGAAVSAMIGEVAYKLLFYVFYGALAGGVTFCISFVRAGLGKRMTVDLSSASGCAYAVVYIMLISALCTLKLFGLNIGVIAGVAATLTAAYYYRQTGGAVCGALTTCGAFLVSADIGMSVVLLSVAGLLTGYFSPQRSSSSAAFFLGINFVLIVLSGVTESDIYSMFDFMVASVIFTAAAPHFSDKRIRTGRETAEALPYIISTRADFLSGAIKLLRSDSERLTGALSSSRVAADPVEAVSEKVCRDCFRRDICYRPEYSGTLNGLRKLSAMNEFSREEFPYELEDCLHRRELEEEFERSRRERSTDKLMEIRSSDSRAMLSEHIRTLEELITSLGDEEELRFSEPVSRIVRDKLTRFGLAPTAVIAGYNPVNRLLVELYFPLSEECYDTVRICDLISDELGMALSSEEPVRSDREIRLRLAELPEYTAEIYGAASCAEDKSENGDSFVCFGDGFGGEYITLSDGMGSGRQAAIGSRLVVKLFRRLISSGLGLGPSIKLINSIMLTKPGDEAFATLDTMRIDLDSCVLSVIKSGASATLIRHGGEVMRISSPTFPIGIYEQSEAYVRDMQLDDGDIAVMFSDGITENEYRFIRELLLSGDDVRHIVDEICAKAEIFNPAVRADDVTVIGMKVTKRKNDMGAQDIC